MDGTSNVMRRTKGSATKTPVSCPNIIKIYNESMGGVDVIHQKTAAYQLDRKSRFRFYLRIFSSLIGITIVNSRIVYTKVGNSISLLDFKIVVVKSSLGRYINQQRSFCFLFEQNKQPKKHWRHHFQRKYQHTCWNSTGSSCDAIFAKMKELTLKNLYLERPVVCTCAVPKREIAF